MYIRFRSKHTTDKVIDNINNFDFDLTMKLPELTGRYMMRLLLQNSELLSVGNLLKNSGKI